MTPYQQKKQNRRTLISFLAAFLFHILVAGGILLYDLLFVEDLSDYAGPVLVKLGEPEGEDIPVLPEEDPAETPEPRETVPSPPSDRIDQAQESPAEPLPEPVSDTAELPAPVEEPVPSEPATPSAASSDTDAVDSPPEPEPQPVKPEPKIVKGTEGGNSWEERYNSGGRVGRSLGADISLYMPLPEFVPSDVIDGLQGDSHVVGLSRKDFVLRYYALFNREYKLEAEASSDDRRSLWSYLINAGYNYKEADYKYGGFLEPVILEFTIPAGGGEVEDIRISQSSRNPVVDQAVLEGFRNATFYNSEDRPVSGRFTYRFEEIQNSP
ncbi:MAG: hypothetical protein PQJ58_14105 [Spirochaetales bacterium]|nr:hypothetical protein [Spirochaetales bacterium]